MKIEDLELYSDITNKAHNKLLKNVKGVKSLIFQLLNTKEKQFEICFEYFVDGIEWDDYQDLIKNNDYSALEEVIIRCFRPEYNFEKDECWGSISCHPDFMLTIRLEMHTEKSIDFNISKEDDHYFCVEYEITDDGIFEIEYGTTKKFLDSLNEN